jgi:peptidoglycan hydrolase-like protein with peptidoglycan-binding domain
MQPQVGMAMQVTRPNLSRGQIRLVQSALNRDGFPVGRVDGIWGANTQTALQNFQTSRALAPTGQLDKQTFAALNLPTRFALRHRALARYRAPVATAPAPAPTAPMPGAGAPTP